MRGEIMHNFAEVPRTKEIASISKLALPALAILRPEGLADAKERIVIYAGQGEDDFNRAASA